MDFKKSLSNYAKLAVKLGVNIQKGQDLVINSPIECAEFARLAAEQAYIAGAKEVIVNWSDEKLSKLKYVYADDEVLSTVHPWLVEARMTELSKKAAFLSIHASDPTLLADVDPQKIKKAMMASNIAFKEFSDALSANQSSWCVVSVPTDKWAEKVFEDQPENAVDKLWEAIFKTVRCDKEDPVEEWYKHIANIKQKTEFLNKKQFDKLIYKNSLGTDIEIGLAKNHIWSGASEENQSGIEFVANMPTEEVFTAPDVNRVDGVIYSSMPLVYNGNVIKNFKLTFKDGKVINCQAQEGEQILKDLLAMDEQACSIGEVALVPYNSPISQMGILFYNTLFDENASCHLAFGSAYPNCIEGGSDLSEEELQKRGLNTSMIHVDFMVGTKDLSISGVDKDGNTTPIFENGDWAF